ncbi:hypothetical protein [Pinibacter aurantiacus]|uniref:Uncharacterized protein n=1 Tax=Pinibacter aurantiacus TaxID=2851599 RepID=A0A9E2SAP7_9BACT|nr:hypothetical protein [Pinibacter aurantiacus]MBV4359081.1 hypothetical protein [Pinibacter aurantiacus]
MTQIIDWGAYCNMMLLILILYYGVIGVKYYKYELLHLFGIRKVDKEQKKATESLDRNKAVEG